MATITSIGNVLLHRFITKDPTVETPILNEINLDMRGPIPVFRIGDGVTPGGVPLSGTGVSKVLKPSIILPMQYNNTPVKIAGKINTSDYLGYLEDFIPSTHTKTLVDVATSPSWATASIATDVEMVGAKLTNFVFGDIPAIEASTGYYHYMRIRYEDENGLRSGYSEYIRFTKNTTYTT